MLSSAIFKTLLIGYAVSFTHLVFDYDLKIREWGQTTRYLPLQTNTLSRFHHVYQGQRISAHIMCVEQDTVSEN
jgi:hypothetical protein